MTKKFPGQYFVLELHGDILQIPDIVLSSCMWLLKADPERRKRRSGSAMNYSEFANAVIYAVTYGNNIFVALGSGSAGSTSSDGINWVQRNGSPSLGSNLISFIEYVNGNFIAGGQSGIFYTSMNPSLD